MSDTREHRDEIIRLVKGSPQPEVGIGSLAERTGLSERETRELVDRMIADGELAWHDDRLVAVERERG